MTLTEDLLLIAVGPRDGLIRAVERIEVALRAMELIELAQAGRIGVDGRRITVIDPAPLGHPRLDRALASLQDGSQARTLNAWLLQHRTGPGLINQYLGLLVRQGAIRIEYRDLVPVMCTGIVIVDQQRRDRARAGIDVLARSDGRAASAADRAMAVVIHTCGLDRHLYRGLRGGSARGRLARLTDPRQTAETIATADAVVEAAGGMAELTGELPDLMRRVYRIQRQRHATGLSAASGRWAGHAGTGDFHRVRIVEADGFTTRHAVISMRRRDTPLRFVLVPMAHVALPGFYEQVRRRLNACDLIVAEGIHGRNRQVRTLTLAYRLIPYRRRHGLVLQNYKTLLPPDVPVLKPDVSATEAVSDLRALGWRLYPLLLIAAPIVGIFLAIRGPGVFLEHNIDATQPSTITGADVLMPNDDLDPVEQALRGRRDRRLLEELDDVYEQHHDEPLVVAVVYGAAHMPEVYAHLYARHRYRPDEPEWVTALSLPGNWI